MNLGEPPVLDMTGASNLAHSTSRKHVNPPTTLLFGTRLYIPSLLLKYRCCGLLVSVPSSLPTTATCTMQALRNLVGVFHLDAVHRKKHWIMSPKVRI
jgi:hypothetical protein